MRITRVIRIQERPPKKHQKGA